jgi:hypothetical protein
MIDDEIVTDTPKESEVLRRLAALPAEAEPSRDLWPAVAARIAESRPPLARSPRRFLAQAAAALLLFASGVAAGQRWGAREAAAARTEPARDAFVAAAEVQRTGTEYVAALRSLAECPDGSGAREQGREAALSAFYGAANELVRLTPGDAGTGQILDAVWECRVSNGRTVRF